MAVTPSYRILRAEHTSYGGDDWRVDIHDSSAAGTNTRETYLSASGISIKMEGRNELYDWIHPTTAEFELMINSQDLEDTVLAFADSGPQRYYAFIYKNSTRVFVGMIVNDTVEIEDTPFPYKYKIKAIDGLSTLKDAEYSSNGVPFSGREEFSRIITRALGFMPTAGFYDNSAPPSTGFFLRTCINWRETQMITGDPLELTKVDHIMFDKRDEYEDEPEFSTAWEVLELCCIRWGARLFYWDNSYWFYQPHVLAASSSQTVYNYLRNATNSTSSGSVESTIDIYDATNTSADAKPKAAGLFTYFKSIKRVRLRFQLSHYNFLKDYKYGSAESNGTMTISDIDTTSGDLQLIFGGSLFVKVYDDGITEGVRFYDNNAGPDSNDWAPAHIIFKFRIQIGTQYLRRRSSGSYGNLSYHSKDGIQGVWTTTESDYEINTGPFTWNGDEGDFDFANITHRIPNEGTTDITWDYIGYDLVKPAGHPGSDFTIDMISWELFDGGFWLKDSLNPIKIKKYQEHIATNSTNNSRELYYEIPFADDTRAWSVDRVTVNDGSGWRISVNWQEGGAGTQYAMGELFVYTLASLQKLPLKIRTGGFINADVKPYSLLNYQGDDFMPVTYEYNSERDEVEGEFIALRQDTNNIDLSEIISEVVRQNNIDISYAQKGTEGHSFYTGLEGIKVTRPITAGAATSIDISAPGYDSYKDGDIIRLVDFINGNTETLEVTANVDSIDTTISVTGTLSNDYNVDTRIFLDPNWAASKTPRENATEYGNWDNVTAAFVDLTTPTSGDAITPPDSDTLTTTEINKRITVWRNGVKQRYRGDYSGAFTDYGYKLDDDNSRIYFYPSLEAEDVEIENRLI